MNKSRKNSASKKTPSSTSSAGPSKRRSPGDDWDDPAFATVFRAGLNRQTWFRALAADIRDEVVQDALEILLAFEGDRPNNPIAYAVTVARNRAAFLAGRRTSERKKANDIKIMAVAQASPESLVSAAEREVRLLSALKNLPPTQQRVVRLMLQQGQSAAEVSKNTGLSLNAVHKHLSRAVERLREEID